MLGGADGGLGFARDEQMKNGDLVRVCGLCVWWVVVMVLLMCAAQRFFPNKCIKIQILP